MANLTQRLTSISTSPRSGPPPGRRLVALILAAALVLASTFPGFALAGEADSEGEGSTPPIEVPVGPPDFDPGGEEEALEEEVPATDDEGTAVEPEAEVEIEVPAPEEVTDATTQAPVEAAPPPPAPAPEPTASEPVQQETTDRPEPVANQTINAPKQKEGAGSTASESAAPGEATATDEPAPPPSEPSQQKSPQPVAADPARNLAGKDTYVVRPGDCLWHIAADLLPIGADAATVEDEIERLWRLNEGRIGTGDPNLIYAGTELRLR